MIENLSENKIIQISPKLLTPNKFSEVIYGKFNIGKEDDFILYQSIKEKGIEQPLVISKKNVIISGVRRFRVAQKLELKTIPVIVNEIDEVKEINVIISNQHRRKNDVLITYEYEVFRKHIGSKQGKKNISEEDKETKQQLGKRVSDGNKKRVVSSVKMHQKLNPEKSEKECWFELIRAAEEGKTINSIHKNLEHKTSKLQNSSLIDEYENFEHECFKIIQGDSFDAHTQIQDNSIDCLTTSPPYWEFRFYDQNEGIPKRVPLGNESSVDEYISALVEIIVRYKDKMKETSSLFINVMDKTLKGKKLNIPAKLSLKMEEHGFEYIGDIMWYKVNPQYSGKKGGTQTNCEYILHFTKSVEGYYRNEYWVDELESRDFINDVLYGSDGESPLIKNIIIPLKPFFEDGDFFTPPLISTKVMSKHSLGNLLEKKGFKLTHDALYGYEIPMICILPTTKKKDICLDIFSGLATTGIVAYATDRSYIGVENSQIYATQSKARFMELFKEKFPDKFIE